MEDTQETIQNTPIVENKNPPKVKKERTEAQRRQTELMRQKRKELLELTKQNFLDNGVEEPETRAEYNTMFLYDLERAKKQAKKEKKWEELIDSRFSKFENTLVESVEDRLAALAKHLETKQNLNDKIYASQTADDDEPVEKKPKLARPEPLKNVKFSDYF
jgi:hypothetical protein